MTQDLTSLIHSHSAEELKRAAAHEGLSEELALVLLERRDLPAEALEAMSKNVPALKSRRVLAGMIGHPKTPRHVCLPAIRHLYTFELMQLALSPAVLADIRKAAEETLILRLEKNQPGRAHHAGAARLGPGSGGAAARCRTARDRGRGQQSLSNRSADRQGGDVGESGSGAG
ncbi:MAG TPA: hypothetical protein VKB60_12740 [Terriglobales bacterium]|nr:hypothetical protein [Terriglobales bacterium]